MQRFRGGLVLKTHRLLYYSTLGVRVLKKQKKWFGYLGSEREAFLEVVGREN